MVLLGGAAFAQTDDVATREISSLDFQKQRQKPETGEKRVNMQKNATPKQRKNLTVITNARRRYNLVRRVPAKTTVAARIDKQPNGNSQKASFKTEQIGVTFWRLRPIAADDGDVPVFSVRIGDGRENWTAARPVYHRIFALGLSVHHQSRILHGRHDGRGERDFPDPENARGR
jgi:hypothetical protein